jgi:hypothetical protein
MDVLAMPYHEQRDSRIGLEGLREVTEQAKNSLESPPAFAGRLTDNSQCHYQNPYSRAVNPAWQSFMCFQSDQTPALHRGR